MTKPDFDKLTKVPSEDYKWLFDDSPRDDFVSQIISVGPDAYVSEDEEYVIFTEAVLRAHADYVYIWEGIIAIPYTKYDDED